MPFTTDQRIEFFLGDDYEREIAITDEDTGEPLDLTSATIKAFVRADLSGGALAYTLTTETNGGLVIANAQGGVVSIAPTRSVQTALSMTAASRVFALKVLLNGVEKVVATGPFISKASLGSIS
jgi:hypothetical protein